MLIPLLTYGQIQPRSFYIMMCTSSIYLLWEAELSRGGLFSELKNFLIIFSKIIIFAVQWEGNSSTISINIWYLFSTMCRDTMQRMICVVLLSFHPPVIRCSQKPFPLVAYHPTFKLLFAVSGQTTCRMHPFLSWITHGSFWKFLFALCFPLKTYSLNLIHQIDLVLFQEKATRQPHWGFVDLHIDSRQSKEPYDEELGLHLCSQLEPRAYRIPKEHYLLHIRRSTHIGLLFVICIACRYF